jgi:cell fate (sporulation/competence/biofilm development) regulator YlbF (YheA/YmcA/DUF963 family)
MANEYDDDEIIDVQTPEEDEDEIDSIEAAPGLLSRIMDKSNESLQSGVQSLADIAIPTLETAHDFSVGTAKGLTMGAMDEIGGMLGAGIETGLGKLGIGPAAVDAELAEQGFTGDVGESFIEKYRGYQQASEKAQDEAAERSPIAETLGQVAGGITSGVATGGLLGVGKTAQGAQTLSEIAKNSGKAKAAMELLKRGGASYLKATPVIAAESALSSKERLIGEGARPEALAADVAGGLAFGVPAVLGMEAVSQAVVPSVGRKLGAAKKAVADAFADEGHPRLRQLAKAYKEYGQELGIHPRSHAADIAGEKFAQRDSKASSKVLDVINTADSKLGQEVGQSLEKATQRGALVDISPDIQAAADRVNELAQRLPSLGQTRKSAAAYEKMLAGQAQLTPQELHGLVKDIDAAIGTFKSITHKDEVALETLSELNRFRSSISDTLKKNVPEYRAAAERFEGFRNVLEQLVSGDRPADVTNVFFGNLRQQDQKLYDKVIDLIRNVQRSDQASQPQRTAFTNFMDALEKFQADDLQRLAADPSKSQVLPDSTQLRKFILEASDDSVLRGSVRSTTESRSVVPDVREALIGKAPTSGAYLAGKSMKAIGEIGQKPIVQKTANLAKSVFKAPTQSVTNLASRLEASDNFKTVGKALREAVENGDTAKKNAALFTIMQNPNARAFISAEDFPDVEEE